MKTTAGTPTMGRTALGVLAAAAVASCAATGAAGRAQGPTLAVVARSDGAVWNAVAVAEGRLFLAGPRWAGSKLPPLVMVSGGAAPVPYPDASWNAWHPGGDPARAFVDINAIHMDPTGALWVVDTGAPDFGGDPLPGGAKLVCIQPSTGVVDRVIAFGPTVAEPGSYVDDVRFHGNHAYLTDAGRPGIIVVDLATASARRVLDGHSSTVAPRDRTIVVGGDVVRTPDGRPLAVNADPLEVSPDGTWLYYAPLEGPWSRVPTRLLDDASATPEQLAAAVDPWIDLPPVGGTAMDAGGNLYFSDLARDAVMRRSPDGSRVTVVQDPRLHWVDAPFLAADGTLLYLPAAQMDRAPVFHHGRSGVQGPTTIYSVRVH